MAITEDLSAVTVSLAPGRATIGVSGELDVNTVRGLRQAAATTAGQDIDVTIDLGEATFISAAGLEALVTVAKVAREGGRAFAIQRPPPRMRRLLAIAGLIESLSIAGATE
jgi:anti-anti-sigma factor